MAGFNYAEWLLELSLKKKSTDFSVRNVLHDRLNPLHPNISMHILYTVL